ncbi:MAG: 50S ribosomal protein L21 [Deltaproteobacteria bacterium HGW-Deltaproteobacteria-15]|jgi:large subunit ribosomal protein L21|nr:MAG: 50S ribosomal protein L21 [Deltaproteobacteria bacterium HGW-Deltaproteobacteria-15]
MHAVFQSGGKQYRVAPGDSVMVEKVPGNAGDSVIFDRIILTSDGEQVSIGKPYLDNAKVEGRITRQGKARKVIAFKFKRRKGFRKKIGHRQQFTQVKIENIQV